MRRPPLRLSGHRNETNGKHLLLDDSGIGIANSNEILRRPAHRQDHAPALGQLIHQRLRDVVGSGGDDDGIERGMLGPSAVAVSDPHAHAVVAERIEDRGSAPCSPRPGRGG